MTLRFIDWLFRSPDRRIWFRADDEHDAISRHPLAWAICSPDAPEGFRGLRATQYDADPRYWTVDALYEFENTDGRLVCQSVRYIRAEDL